MVENSPALQRWAPGNKRSGVPEGRLMQRIVSAVPSGRNRSGSDFPTLKRWAILIGPFGTKNWFELNFSNPSGIGRPGCGLARRPAYSLSAPAQGMPHEKKILIRVDNHGAVDRIRSNRCSFN